MVHSCLQRRPDDDVGLLRRIPRRALVGTARPPSPARSCSDLRDDRRHLYAPLPLASWMAPTRPGSPGRCGLQLCRSCSEIGAPAPVRVASTVAYVAMGWAVVIFMQPLLGLLDRSTVILLVSGGGALFDRGLYPSLASSAVPRCHLAQSGIG